MSGHTVFLAGATGVIGRRVVPLLVAAGHRVTAVGRTADKRASLERAGAIAVDMHLFDPVATRRALQGHDVVINLATQIPPTSRVRRGWAPAFGSPEAYISSVSHDDAAAAVLAALGVPAGTYNVSDDSPLRRREFADALAAAVGVPAPRFFPGWVAKLAGSLGETLTRSQRMRNTKLRDASTWVPRYPSVVEGWRATVAALSRELPREMVHS
jgi:nucleoside-diphosphate-sugar epimerase